MRNAKFACAVANERRRRRCNERRLCKLRIDDVAAVAAAACILAAAAEWRLLLLGASALAIVAADRLLRGAKLKAAAARNRFRVVRSRFSVIQMRSDKRAEAACRPFPLCLSATIKIESGSDDDALEKI